MFAFTEFDDADLRDESWVDLFPWLDSYESSDAAHLEDLVPGVEDWWIADSPRLTRADAVLDDLVTALAALIVRRHRNLLFAQLAPGLGRSIPLAALRLGPRPESVVRRLAARDSVDALLATDVETLFSLRGTSPETVEHIVAGVLGSAILLDPACGVSPDDGSDHPAATQLVDDLRLVSRWCRLRGRVAEPLILIDIEDGAPEDVQKAASRVAALTASDLDALVESNPIDEVENLVEQLDERQGIALREYLTAISPISMGELSSRLHVSKSRAGVLVAEVKNDFAEACGFHSAAGGLVASIRAELEPVASLERLLRLHPILTQVIPTLDVPLWLVLARLGDVFEVDGGWVVAPNAEEAKDRTVAMLEQIQSRNGVVALASAAEALNLSVTETREWLSFSRIPVISDHALLSVRRLVDHAVGVLEAVERSLTTSELIEILDTDRSESTLERYLADDDRVIRSDGRWMLAETAAADTVGAQHDRLVEIRNTPHLYRLGRAWIYRLSVTPDHFTGSGLTIPVGVAAAFGCLPGATHEIPSRLGQQIFRWTGTDPTCDAIRRFLVDISAEPKDTVFLIRSDDIGFDIRRLAESAIGDPLRHALAMIGHPEPDSVEEAAIPEMLAVAAGLPPVTKPRRILSAYQTRDDVVSELLETKWLSVPR